MPSVMLYVLVRPLLALLSAIAALFLTAIPTTKVEAQGRTGPLVARLASTESEVIDSYIGGRSPNSPRYYAAGHWYAKGGLECWNCYDAAGTAAGVLFKQGIGGEEYRRIAVATTDAAINERQRRDGSFEGSAASNAPITTAFYAVQLGIAYLELHSELDAATRNRWSSSLASAARFLVQSGQTTWYINGNINIRETEVMWLAWQATGDQYFARQYEAEWAFTTAPPQSRWPGFGLRLSVVPTRADGSNGSGYLAESGGGAPGFDPEYTMLQLDTATQMYVLSREARWLRMVNLLYNQLRPLVEVTAAPRFAWDLNATRGSRKNQKTPFTTPALYVLVAGGHRPDLAPGLGAQLASIENEFHGAMSFANANLYRDLAEELATPLLAEQWPSGVGTPAQRHLAAKRSPATSGRGSSSRH